MSGFITSDGAEYMLGTMAGIIEAKESLWVALVYSQTGFTETGVEIDEVVDPGYSRAQIDKGHWYIYQNSLTNQEEVVFPVPTEPWLGITGYAICDSEFEGKVLFAGDIPVSDIDVDEQFYIPAGGITIDLELHGWMRSL